MKNTIKEENLIITKRELRTMLIARLNSLHSDVNNRDEKAERYLADLKKTRREKQKALMDLYAGENAPVKVTDLSGLPRSEGDMTGEMIDFSQGFDEYIASLEKAYADAKKRRNEAMKLLTMLMTLKAPYSMILYLRYYRKLSPKDACFHMHIARSTLFRKQSTALTLLSEMYAERNGIIIKSDK